MTARQPQAFRLEPDKTEPTLEKRKRSTTASKIRFTIDPTPQEIAPSPMAQAKSQKKQRGMRWGHIFLAAIASLIALWFSLTISNMITSFFAWSLTLGWISVALATLAGLAALIIIAREIWGLFGLRRIEHLQIASAKAINQNDAAAAATVNLGLKTLYQKRADLAYALAQWREYESDIIDPPAAMRLAERHLLEPLDEAAHAIIAKRAKRVTLLSTVTPTAALDVLLVGSQNLFMIREIATLYGGRPSFLATLKLARMVVTHLAVTAGLALSENALHLFVGKGLLGRISARFGEGAINGILTSRIGLAASDVCRPIASTASRRETLSSLIREISGFGGGQDAEN